MATYTWTIYKEVITVLSPYKGLITIISLTIVILLLWKIERYLKRKFKEEE